MTDKFITARAFADVLPGKLRNYVSCLKQETQTQTVVRRAMEKKKLEKGNKEPENKNENSQNRGDKPADKNERLKRRVNRLRHSQNDAEKVKHKNVVNGFECKKYFDNFTDTCASEGREKRCFQKLHDKKSSRYDVSIKDEMKIAPETFLDEKLKNHQQCLQEVQTNIESCLTPLIKQCQESSIRAAKVVRPFLNMAVTLLRKDPYIKIILYVRDPRGVLESRFRRAGKDVKIDENLKLLEKDAALLCSKMKADYSVFQELSSLKPRNFLLVKYEDVVARTPEDVKNIYKFIDRTVPKSVLNFFKNATSATKNGHGMNTIRKNATLTAEQWKKNLQPEIIKKIEEICEPVLLSFGYL